MKLTKPVINTPGFRCECYKDGKRYYNVNGVARGAADFDVEDDVTEAVYFVDKAGLEPFATHLWTKKNGWGSVPVDGVEDAIAALYPVKKETTVKQWSAKKESSEKNPPAGK